MKQSKNLLYHLNYLYLTCVRLYAHKILFFNKKHAKILGWFDTTFLARWTTFETGSYQPDDFTFNKLIRRGNWYIFVQKMKIYPKIRVFILKNILVLITIEQVKMNKNVSYESCSNKLYDNGITKNFCVTVEGVIFKSKFKF